MKKNCMIGFRCTAETQSEIEGLALVENRSVSQMTAILVQEALQNRKRSAREGKEAKEVMDFIDAVDFRSFGEFLQVCKSENKTLWVEEKMGWFLAYHYVCAKLGIHPKRNFSVL